MIRLMSFLLPLVMAVSVSVSAQEVDRWAGVRLDVIEVAPGTAVPTPSAAAKIAKDGDTVLIAAADYRGDVAVWRQDNLILRGVGGRPHLIADGKAAQAKAIWVIAGDNVTVENIEFSGAAVRDLNGAGIRAEGAGLTIENCYFHGNEMGVMSGKNLNSDIVIRNSEFFANIVKPHPGWEIGHNIYIGTIRSFTLIGSKIHGAQSGHNVKSRAAHNIIIDNDIYDGPQGRASYMIDLPAGGVAILRNNRIHQGRNPENSTIVSYGAEKNLHPENRLLVVGNRIVNDSRSAIFVRNHLNIEAELVDNQFIGPGRPLRGPGRVTETQASAE